MYRIRLNLGAGENFMKWKVMSDSQHCYYDPALYNLLMFRCKLINNPKAAQKIFEGANKDVCAWIECEELHIFPAHIITDRFQLRQIFYNPKKNPFWFNTLGDNIDNAQPRTIETEGRNVFYYYQ